MYKKLFFGFVFFVILQNPPKNLAKKPLKSARIKKTLNKKYKNKISKPFAIGLTLLCLGGIYVYHVKSSQSAELYHRRIEDYKLTEKQYQQAVQNSWKKFSGKQGAHNKADNFVGVKGMANKLFEQLEEFEKAHAKNDRKFIQKKHYDWWTFPIPYHSSAYKTKYAAYGKDIEALKKYTYQGKQNKYYGMSYLEAQRKATKLVLWGAGWWDLKKNTITWHLDHIYSKDRLLKMLHGTLLLDKEMYEITNALLSVIKEKHPGSYHKAADDYFTPL